MNTNREGLAWTIMLAAFAAFCSLLTGLPYGAWLFIQNATDTPMTTLYANQGNVFVATAPDTADLRVTTGLSVTLAERNTISTDTQADSRGTLEIHAPNGHVFLSLIVYADTRVTLTQLDTPQFSLSLNPNQFVLQVEHGRVRLQIPDDAANNRALFVTLHTPFGDAQIHDGGAYLVEIEPDQAQVIVTRSHSGVTVTCANGGAVIVEGHRAVLEATTCRDEKTLARNILENGHFENGGISGWAILTGTTPGTPDGRLVLIPSNLPTENALQLERTANDWGKVGVQQELDRYVGDQQRVILRLDVRIDHQDPAVDLCGVLATECPIMVRIEFEDERGKRRSWLHGFYILDNPSIDTPSGCPASCGDVHAQNWYRLNRPGEWEPYTSDNLIALMRAAGFKPTTINLIEIYASGHSFTSLIRDVQLLIEE